MTDFDSAIQYKALTEKAFSNLAALATSEQRAISLWQTIRTWGAEGAREAQYIAEMETLYEGFIDYVLKGRTKPTHLAALAARGDELDTRYRKRLMKSRQVTVTRVLAAQPWIAQMEPGSRDNLIYSSDPDTRLLVAGAGYLSEDERVEACQGTDPDGNPWYHTWENDPIGYYYYARNSLDDLPLHKLVRSWSTSLHNYLLNKAWHRMGRASRQALFIQIADTFEERLARALEGRGGHPYYGGSALLSTITRQAMSTDVAGIVEVISEAQKKAQAAEKGKTPGRGYSNLDRKRFEHIDWDAWRQAALQIGGADQDEVIERTHDAVGSGSLIEIERRHYQTPLIEEETRQLARRCINRTESSRLMLSEVVELFCDLKISSAAAAAFYREVADTGNKHWCLRPDDEFVALMTTKDAVDTLLVPAALECLSPEQLKEALGGEEGSLWHKTLSQWPDTLGSLLTITGDE